MCFIFPERLLMLFFNLVVPVMCVHLVCLLMICVLLANKSYIIYNAANVNVAVYVMFVVRNSSLGQSCIRKRWAGHVKDQSVQRAVMKNRVVTHTAVRQTDATMPWSHSINCWLLLLRCSASPLLFAVARARHLPKFSETTTEAKRRPYTELSLAQLSVCKLLSAQLTWAQRCTYGQEIKSKLFISSHTNAIHRTL